MLSPTRESTAALLLSSALLAAPASAVPVVYSDEASYLAALTAGVYTALYEGFESDAAWGSVRTVAGVTQSAPSVTSLGITWTADNTNSGVTTPGCAALAGSWGF